MKPVSLLALAFIISTLVSAQRSSLNIVSEDGEKFFVYISGKVQNKHPVNRINLPVATGKSLLRIVFVNKDLDPVSQAVYVAKNEASSYVLSQKPVYYLQKGTLPTRHDDFPERRYRDTGRFYNDRRDNDYIRNGTLCGSPSLSEVAFLKAKKEVSEASLNHKKAAVIKRIIESNCLLASQAASLVSTLSPATNDQLETARLAYMHLYDTENFNEVINVVTSNNDKKELREFARADGSNDNQRRWPAPRETPANRSQTYDHCNKATLNASQFGEALQSIKSASFDKTRLEQAKLITEMNCLSVAQVREIMKALDFEASKLEFAKLAYDRTYDRNSYYLVNQEFTFETSRSELTTYITGRQ